MCNVLWDGSKAGDALTSTIEAVETALAGSALTRDVVKTQAFTDVVLAAVGVPAKSSRSSGP
ncbi:hypothetical protein [Kibdelosporangium aridum]|uniref:hypothetical protein n=1 Tax=Kibdelosporangium aridum TaxID=2030 RepID=UPI0005254C17